MKNILRTEGVKKTFGKFRALNGIDLEVREGEIHAIIGPNGAGKTTFFNVITGKLSATSGKVYFNEEDITEKPPHEIVGRGIARTFQIVNIFLNLTVEENIMIPLLQLHKKSFDLFPGAGTRDYIRKETIKILKVIGMDKQGHTLAAELSHGDKKKLDMGIGLAENPKLLLLDEPMAGLNPVENQAIRDLIKRVAERENVTIILIEHDMDTIFSISDMITVFQQGSVIAEDKPENIRLNRLVIQAYLGEEF